MALRTTCCLFISLLLLTACSKKEETVVGGNVPKNYNDVPTVKVENYINRIYIDLLGREPLNSEKSRDVSFLRNGQLSYDTRKTLITRLMTDSIYVPGDSSYRRAYYQRLYDLSKARLLEGASDDEIAEPIGNAQFALISSRLTGDSIGVFSAMLTIDQCNNVLRSRRNYQLGNITINQMYAYMLENPTYDLINMNTLNFVNASFDDLFFRFPIKDEFDIAYDIIESGKGGSLFGSYATNKPEYCQMLTQSREFHEGMIKWCYLTLIGREPSTQETYNLMQDYYVSKNLQK
ncbi:MAG: hypothetical protein V4613_12085, partial [Bacteroidota bacterium]